MSILEFFSRFWQDIAGWALIVEFPLTIATLCWVLHIKREPMSAIAWSLCVLLIPFLGALLFFLFGFQTIHAPLARRQERRESYRRLTAVPVGENPLEPPARPSERGPWDVIVRLAQHPDGFPLTAGNRVDLYHLGEPAYQAMLLAIAAAKHHVHMEFFIVRSDDSGKRFMDALAAAAQRGVEVRFLYDSIGSYSLSRYILEGLRASGGKVCAFLPILNPLNRLRINLRNHRKILVVDGTVGFTGGLNIGDEYLGKNAKFGHWRDTFLRVEGAAAGSLQRIFLEDWYFASEEALRGAAYQPPAAGCGDSRVQVVHSGPDTDYKAIRETYFAAITRARTRVWIASPYHVPDSGLLDALILAGRAGIDVRLLGLFRPDKWIPFLAARYYWTELLGAGVKVYQYTPGMMHSKYMLIDGEWASVGSANMDNRSLFLNYEANCLIYDGSVVADLEAHFLEDLAESVRIDPAVYARRPFVSKLAENTCRLFSPVL